MISRRKLLVISKLRFWDKAKGSSLRVQLLLEQLLDEFDVDLFLTREIRAKDETRIRGLSPRVGSVVCWRSVEVLPWDLISASRMALGRDSSRPAGALPEDLQDWRISRALRRQLRRVAYDVVLFEYIWTVKYLNPATAPVMPRERWVDTHDVMHQRAESERLAGIPVTKPITAEEEAAFLTPFTRIIAIQPEEAAEFARLVPGKEVVTISTVPKVDRTPYPVPPAMAESSFNMVHVSSTGRIAIQSLRWFIDEIWLSVLDRKPDARLHVIGSICKAFEKESAPGIVAHGYVENLAPFYQHAGLVVNPCLAGSGLKIKTVEALGYGCRVLTTGFGAQGIDPSVCPGLIVRDPSGFEAALAKVISGDAVEHFTPASGFQPV